MLAQRYVSLNSNIKQLNNTQNAAQNIEAKRNLLLKQLEYLDEQQQKLKILRNNQNEIQEQKELYCCL